MSRVIVLGSVNQDIVTNVEKHPSFNESVFASSLRYFPGGRGANQSVAAASAGAETILVGAVGNDAPGHTMLDFLKDKSVATNHIAILDVAPTGIAVVTVDARGQHKVVVVSGANEFVVDDPLLRLQPTDILLSQFEVPDSSIISFFRRGKDLGCTTILNPGPPRAIPVELARLVDICVLEGRGLGAIAGTPIDEDSDLTNIADAARSMCAANERLKVVATLGSRGAFVISPYDFEAVTGHNVKEVDTTGAEDCFVGSVAARIALGDNLSNALSYAIRAATISVKREGAGSSLPTADEVNAFVG